VERRDTAGLERFLSPGFQIQRADGTHADKAEYIANLPSLSNPQVQGLQATLHGSVLVVRYEVSAEQIVDGHPYRPGFAPRLSVFVAGKRGWQLVAHANFNVPG
jgi:hypothetical protein